MASTDNVLRGINHLLTGKEKCNFQVIQCRRGLIQCKEATNETEQSLELFSSTLTFFAS